MRRFQRIILLIFGSLLLSTSVASAQLVQLSDLGAERFYLGLKIIAGQLHESSGLQELTHIGRESADSPYDSYITSWDGTVIFIFANQAGYVSKVVVSGVRTNDPLAAKEMARALFAISLCTGLTQQEISSLSYTKAMSTGYESIWGSAVHRRIAIEFYVYRNQANCFRFVAYDR